MTAPIPPDEFATVFTLTAFEFTGTAEEIAYRVARGTVAHSELIRALRAELRPVTRLDGETLEDAAARQAVHHTRAAVLSRAAVRIARENHTFAADLAESRLAFLCPSPLVDRATARLMFRAEEAPAAVQIAERAVNDARDRGLTFARRTWEQWLFALRDVFNIWPQYGLADNDPEPDDILAMLK